MCGKSAVGVDHKLSAGESGVRRRAAFNKSSRRIDQNFGLIIKGEVLKAIPQDMAVDVLGQFIQGL